MTKLFDLYNEDREAFRTELESMTVGELFAELDDTIQLDMLKMDNDEWARFKEKKVYQAIVTELRSR